MMSHSLCGWRVLLYGDIQIRLTVIRPTFPVMAFEAPGALGCEKPMDILRRSDPQAGWEYAEVRWSRRQLFSAWLAMTARTPAHHSWINPISTLLIPIQNNRLFMSRRQALLRVVWLPRRLSARHPFDPAMEFAGIKVETESPEIFRCHPARSKDGFGRARRNNSKPCHCPRNGCGRSPHAIHSGE